MRASVFEQKDRRHQTIPKKIKGSREEELDSMFAGPENVVVVAVRAEREISKAALAWALTHVVRPGDLVTLLAVISDQEGRGWRRRLWSFPKFNGDRSTRRPEKSQSPCPISASCSQMALQIDGQNEINVRIKVVGSDGGGSSSEGVVAAESKRVGANWIVLDKQLKQEEKLCMEKLQCNIVVMKGSHAKVRRLNLGGPREPYPPLSSSSSLALRSGEKFQADRIGPSTPTSGPDDNVKASFRRETRVSESSSTTASPFYVCEQNPLFDGFWNGKLGSKDGDGVLANGLTASDSDSNGGRSPLSSSLGLELNQNRDYRDSSRIVVSNGTHPKLCCSHPASTPPAPAHNHEIYWITQNHNNPLIKSSRPPVHSTRPPLATRTLLEKFAEPDHEPVIRKLGLHPSPMSGYISNSDVREAVSLFRNSPSIPPPLCSFCRHKAPLFGKPPRQFGYRELEEATGGFSDENFLAESGFGCVHRGVLGDGQVVAVKRLKAVASGSRGDDEFREDAEVLGRAQHRNVVMLVGFCVEGKRRVLVYEYICNGSLDHHLYGRGKPPLDWHARTKIAVCVARGLRYLHEDCRVGFVVHRDMRPNNILLTHDCEALVGDFSLTKWRQTEGSVAVDTRVVGTFGYLAPEYLECGLITEKSDVYAFGVVLLELITGQRAMDTTRPKGQQLLVEWARPLLSLASEDGRTVAIDRFLDPRLDRDQTRFFLIPLRAMACAASLCLRRDPETRPGMSKVLRILEGDTIIDSGFDINTMGSRSGRMSHPIQHQTSRVGGSFSHRFSNEVVGNALYGERNFSHLY